ncbi:uncharacterized protein N7459_004450 [Penicillium hispanicum]|uniref:uncharacterized protein n=1 Tax=Penicillium hispanicum TaxID=1080232 RepID=UPI0025423603|nr:uncharacterized protein N7459_004450 [Penicillium hispanicum]KAJ5584650.1 hypothetical protein N7459_004450 [Penicillium hispanicum]
MGPLRSKRTRTSDATMSEGENLSHISCEICRQRKCKCDRRLEPSKCVYPESGKRGLPLGYLNQLEHRLAETESALYGALATLRSMRPAAVIQASAKPESMQKQKSTRMDEWSQFPLSGWSDMERWMAAVSDQFIIEQPRGVPGVPLTATAVTGYTMPVSPSRNDVSSPEVQVPVEGPGSSASYAWQPRGQVRTGGSYETHLHPQGIGSSPIYGQGQITGQSEVVASPAGTLTVSSNDPVVSEGDLAGVGEKEQPSGAQELSKRKPIVYF